jgi:hypothetical protein
MKLHLPLLLFATLSLSACGEAGKPYPLDTCIVSGEKLGSMGKPHVIVKDGQQVKFCCAGCEDDFNKEPDKFLKEIAAKVAK